ALGALLGAGHPAERPGAHQEGGRAGPQTGGRVARLSAPARRRCRGPEAPGRGGDGGLGDLSRTATGGLADPMKTKMEMMAGYLAGRQDETAGAIRRELEDPSSEASRWLEAVRARSREILVPGSPEVLDAVATRPGRLPEEPRLIASRPIRNRPTAPAPRVPGKRPSRTLWGASAAALLLLAPGARLRAAADPRRRP